MSHKARYVFDSSDDKQRRNRAMHLRGKAAREWVEKIKREKKEQALSKRERMSEELEEPREWTIDMMDDDSSLVFDQMYSEIERLRAEIERLTSLLELAEFGANSPHLTWNKE